MSGVLARDETPLRGVSSGSLVEVGVQCTVDGSEGVEGLLDDKSGVTLASPLGISVTDLEALARGDILVGALSTNVDINSGTEAGVTFSTNTKAGRSSTVVGSPAVEAFPTGQYGSGIFDAESINLPFEG